MKLRHQGFDELLLLDTQIMPLKIVACTFVLFPTTFLTTAVFWRGLDVGYNILGSVSHEKNCVTLQFYITQK